MRRFVSNSPVQSWIDIADFTWTDVTELHGQMDRCYRIFCSIKLKDMVR